MGREKCLNPQYDCKYYPDCFTDRHHLYPQRLGKTALSSTFINLPCNVVRMCRRLHESQAVEHPLPRKSEMRQAIAQAAINGEVNLSSTKLRKIFGVDSVEEIVHEE